MTLNDATTGGSKALGIAVEYDPTPPSGTPGTPLAPTTFLPTTDINLKADWDFVEPKVQRATRMTDAVMEPNRNDPGGDVTWLLNPALGVEFFLAGFGAKSALSAVTTVSTGIVVTANGVSTVPVTGAFLPGALATFGTGPLKERRQIISYTPGVSVKVGALTLNAATATGMAVVQLAQDKYANSLLSAANSNLLPCLTLEDIYGKSQWSWQYPYQYVDMLDFGFTAKDMNVKAVMKGSAPPNYFNAGNVSPATGTTAVYAPNAGDEAIALNPLTSVNGYVIASGDPDNTGASTVRAALGVKDAKISFTNALIKEEVMNLSTSYIYYPGDGAGCTFDYNELVTSHRPDVWYDNIQANVAAPFLISGTKNFGTAALPVWKGVGFYCPTVKYSKASATGKIGSIDTFAKSGKALAPAGATADYLQVFVAK